MRLIGSPYRADGVDGQVFTHRLFIGSENNPPQHEATQTLVEFYANVAVGQLFTQILELFYPNVPNKDGHICTHVNVELSPKYAIGQSATHLFDKLSANFPSKQLETQAFVISSANKPLGQVVTHALVELSAKYPLGQAKATTHVFVEVSAKNPTGQVVTHVLVELSAK